jgi:hypothetical protein
LSKLLYQIYHANLAFSAIPEEELGSVIEKCYFPLLEFIKTSNTKIALEISGYSLEIIQKLHPRWIELFKELHKQNLIELIGSGYMQIIAPLIPYEVNIKNQTLGLEVYQEILGVTPTIVFVNEQTFSSSLVDIYHEAGYKAIIMEWNNPYATHKEWKKEFSYTPAVVRGIDAKLPIIWSDSILFQQFQRYIHNETTKEEYLHFLDNYVDTNHNILPIYSSDLEIFNYRPGRFETEAVILNDEWERIKNISDTLKQLGTFALPSELLEYCTQSIILSLTNSKSPIVVKKQDKYSLSRWAACGRGAVFINSLCYIFYQTIKQSNDANPWKQLLTYWGSDFRTHITQNKWDKAISFLEQFKKKSSTINNFTKTDKFITKTDKYLEFQKENLKVVFKLNKGLALHAIYKDSKQLPIGTVKHGELDFITHGADYFTGNIVIESSITKKITDLVQVSNVECFELSDDRYKLVTTLQLKHNIKVEKSWIIDCTNHTLSFNSKIIVPEFINGYIRCGAITFLPDLIGDFNIAFKNGGNNFERFDLQNVEINQHLTKSLLQSSSGGIGVTDGEIQIFDKEELVLSIKIDQSTSLPFTMLQNNHISGNKYLRRIFFSLQELDDTLKKNNQKEHAISFSINF